MYEYVIRLRVTDLVIYLIPQHHAISLVYRGLSSFHFMDLPSMGRRLQANFSGVIAFVFSIDVVANTKQKTYQDLVLCSNGNIYQIKHILLRNKVINNRASLKQVVIEKGFSSGQYRLFIAYFQI